MLKILKSFFDILKEAFFEWVDDNASQLAAGISYYTIFSLAPLLVITTSIAGIFFGEDAIQGKLVSEIEGFVGLQTAKIIETMLIGIGEDYSNIFVGIFGFALLFFGASKAVIELENAFNKIWRVKPKEHSNIFLDLLMERLNSFLTIFLSGFLLLSILIISATLNFFSGLLQELLPQVRIFWKVLEFFASLGISSLVFATLFKSIPNEKIAWSDVWLGSICTSLLFLLSKFLLNLYISSGSFATVYGAASSLIILLVWIYYSIQILFLGAEISFVYSKKFGSKKMSA
ncbi:MAG: YihY/virulence factor BrkB family protein [Calditrichaeota bacterium]|nr:MAG: YihY/virulence factor BrkB family protein [Calditrichota bacterium]